MLGLSADGGADQVLFDAIMTFQEGIDSINPDGRIELPRADEKGKRGTTWKELFKSITGHYPSLKEADGGPGSAKSANGKGGESLRPIFPRAQSVIFSGDEKAVYVDPKEPNAKHYDGDGDTLDDTATNMWKAANAAPGYALHKINNVEAATNVLKDYYSSQVSIDTMVVSSHGYREVNNFYVGSTQINAGNVKKLLAPWKPLLNDHTEVIVKACNTGGGTHPEKGKRFTQEIAETLGVTVYTSRSWAVSKTDSFADQPASWYGDPGSFDREDVRKYEDPYQNMGLWLKAMPEKLAQRRATELAEYSREHGMQFDEDAFVRQAKSPQEVFSPILHEDGTFTISDERFPTLSVLDEYEFEHYEWPK